MLSLLPVKKLSRQITYGYSSQRRMCLLPGADCVNAATPQAKDAQVTAKRCQPKCCSIV